MYLESSVTKLVKRNEVVLIGGKRRNGWEFICYKKMATREGIIISFLRYDGESETYNRSKTKVRIFDPRRLTRITNESPVLLGELRGNWVTRRFGPHQTTPKTELPGSFQY